MRSVTHLSRTRCIAGVLSRRFFLRPMRTHHNSVGRVPHGSLVTALALFLVAIGATTLQRDGSTPVMASRRPSGRWHRRGGQG